MMAISQIKERNKITQDIIEGPMGREYCYVSTGNFHYGIENEVINSRAAFYIAKNPVTVAEFTAFLEQTNYPYPKKDLAIMRSYSPYPNCPATNTSWNDAKEYCRWMRKRTNEYFSLPSEIEWEIAARGTDKRIFPWGNDNPTLTHACLSYEYAPETTDPIGMHPQGESPFGCMDLVGNVAEWCLDSFDDERDPHVCRGGSWCSDSEQCHSYDKIFSYPAEKRETICGFRLMYLPEDLLHLYKELASEQKITSETETSQEDSKPIEISSDKPSSIPDIAAEVTADSYESQKDTSNEIPDPSKTAFSNKQ
ncbi:MAG: SUMF1/EgtB/PvdO family nonheme iron enzyme, partial [Verrucomicrobiota bacterium]|nr:SUMF1/EgtB/PvdO family nonheme iron enzyme [Verrucomicrobiota bacterium]